MSKIYYKSIPYVKEDVIYAIESGVNALIVEEAHIEEIKSLARVEVYALSDFTHFQLTNKEDEKAISNSLLNNEKLIIQHGWEIIPVENLLAVSKNVILEANSFEEAKLASQILETGVYAIVIDHKCLTQFKKIITECEQSQGQELLQEAEIIEIENVGLGHRVCLDCLSIFKQGQGLLIGNSSEFSFLVHAETESNPYVASRPFRVNAGAVHAYIQLPMDRTCYLEELRAGHEMKAVSFDGSTSLITLGRAKVEIRPMLKIVAKIADKIGSIFLQNAETICLTKPNGEAVSVVKLQIGDKVLCKLDAGGRHFGMRIEQTVNEF